MNVLRRREGELELVLQIISIDKRVEENKKNKKGSKRVDI